MSVQTREYAAAPPAPDPFGVAERPPERAREPHEHRRATLREPTPGYAHTIELDGFDRPAAAREALYSYAAALVRLGLTPAWGVRMVRHRISRGRVAWFVMLDGPEHLPPRSLMAPDRSRLGGGGGR